MTPSVVAVAEDGRILFGVEAKERQELGYTDTAAFFKRYMGESGYTVEMAGRVFTPVDLSGMLLQGLVRQAEQVSGEKIDGAYITVPAYFRNSEREATIEAGRRAGINVMGILNEPTAAAFAYGLNGRDTHQKVLIYDLGGGTFDVTLAEVDAGSIRILGSDGSHILGGKDWDDAVARWIAEQFEDEFGVDLTSDEEELAKLTVAAENAKKRLTKAPRAVVPVSFGGHRGKYTLDRETFDDVTSFMLQETSDIVDRLFASFDPAVTWDDVDGAILVGGSTRMLQVHDYIERMSGKPPLGGVNVDEAVALGAAIRANQDASGHASPRLTLGGAAGGRPRMLIGGKRITDATSHALGMIAESVDGERYINDVLIAKNAAIPAANTHHVNLRIPRSGGEMEVYLLQGSEERPLDNDVAGKYVFSGIPYVQGGSSNIDVTYSYDENGVIQVSALQRETGRQLAMHREPVPDDMSWTDGDPRDNQSQGTTQPGEIYIAIDAVIVGGSGEGTLDEVVAAAHQFVDEIDLDTFRVGIIGFLCSGTIWQPATSDPGQLHAAIAEMQSRYGQLRSRVDGGDGEPSHPFDTLLSAFRTLDGSRIGIVLTDGVWGMKHRNQAIRQSERCHQLGIETIVLGYGAGEDDLPYLKGLSSMKDLSGATDLSHLNESFSKIARVISA